MCFETEIYVDNGFTLKDILNDYRTIILSYDEDLLDMSKQIERGIIFMIIGISIMFIFEFVLRILLSIN